jgi:hypothetical protein
VDLWRVIGAAGDVPVTRAFRVEKTTTSADVSLPGSGAYLGVMTIVARTAEMKGQEFTEYLNEEGLDAVIAARQASGDADKPAKERYARNAKIRATAPTPRASLGSRAPYEPVASKARPSRTGPTAPAAAAPAKAMPYSVPNARSPK